jgi:hypothetical protein
MSAEAESPLVEHTRCVWQPRAHHELTDDDCREIQRNVLGFMSVLRDWAASERDQAAARVEQPTNATSPTLFKEPN